MCASMQISCVSAEFFLSVVDFFPSFVHQSSIFRVVDVLCAVSYTVAISMNGFFSHHCGFSCVPLCLSVQ